MLKFSHLLVEAESEDDEIIVRYKPNFRINHFVKGFNGIFFSPTSMSRIPLPKLSLAPKIYILKNKS